MKLKNMKGISRLVPVSAPSNSFQIYTPHAAATMVAPWPSPYDMAKPACSDAIMLNDIPIHQIAPPSMPIR